MKTRYEIATAVGYRSLWVNIVLTILKLIVSVTTTSVALIADTIHSGSDVVSTLVVLLGIKIANTPADEDHPYGHGRAETLAASVLAVSRVEHPSSDYRRTHGGTSGPWDIRNGTNRCHCRRACSSSPSCESPSPWSGLPRRFNRGSVKGSQSATSPRNIPSDQRFNL